MLGPALMAQLDMMLLITQKFQFGVSVLVPTSIPIQIHCNTLGKWAFENSCVWSTALKTWMVLLAPVFVLDTLQVLEIFEK